MQQEQVIALREIYWNIPQPYGSLFLYSLIIVTTAVMSWGIIRDISRWRKGRPDPRLDQVPSRAAEFLVQLFGQKKVLRDRRPGSMHALIFFGFLALFIGTDIIAVEEDFTVPLMGEEAGKILVGGFYQAYELILDTLGLVFVLGLLWATMRRYQRKEPRLDSRRTDAWVLAVLLFLGIGGFLIEGLRIANQCWPSHEQCLTYTYEQNWALLSFVGFGLAMLFRAIGLGDGSPVALGLHQLLWFTHAGATAAFIATLPFSKFKHIFYTPLNTFFRDTTPQGALDPIPDLEGEIEKDEPRLGIATLADLSWKQRLDLDACMRCGRCQANCPAHASGADLSPKYIITKLHDLMREEPIRFKDGTVKLVKDLEAGEEHGKRNGNGHAAIDVETVPLYGNLFTENELWSCTTCYACVYECPAMIEHVDDIVGARRHLTMIASEVPAGVKRVLEGIERAGNPWRLPQRERTAWAEGLDVPVMAEKEEAEVLYWVGCAPSYDERSKRVARAFVQLMQLAGVDFAILGEEETCNGDPARRMGEELLYQSQVQQNIETMKQYRFKRVVTTCPHCFNTIKNEYPQFGGGAGTEYEVVHHTQLLDELVKSGKLKPLRPINQTVVYHDPCYIGRYNDVFEPPRQVLQSIPGIKLVEAPERNRERAMCCGGGGGNVWLEGWGKEQVNYIRLEQLVQNQPQTLAMSCPFCMVMFEDAAKNTGRDETLQRRDIAELLLEAVKESP